MKELYIIDTLKKVGETVDLFGFINTRRDHGKIIFIELRDKSGIIQVVFTPENSDLYEKASQLRSEFVVKIRGEIIERPEKMVNKDIATGGVEMQPKDLEILSRADTLPFDIYDDGYEIGEENRLNYRYLDLRRERMRKNLQVRHDATRSIRSFLNDRGFIEVETPMLTKSTKEGSRDFVVPSRIHPGKFYALPQSPQQYKQLLMVAGVERYYQMARAIRDEDPRADRGFEHTQVDLEMSFVERDDVMKMIEELCISLVEKFPGRKISNKPFPVITYAEAMERFGKDKFDMRENPDDPTELAFAWVVDFPFFKEVDKGDVAEMRDGKSGWTFTHNPFSQPKQEHLKQHLEKKNIGEILTTQYDLVCNGFEVGGGSIRAHDPEVLKTTFGIMGYDEDQTKESIGHMLEAFKYGVPPHGGIALGLDRIAMILAGEASMKEVVAFPMSGTGQTSVMEAPSHISKEQLEDIHIKIVDEKKKN